MAIGRAVVYYARVAFKFSDGIKCQPCTSMNRLIHSGSDINVFFNVLNKILRICNSIISLKVFFTEDGISVAILFLFAVKSIISERIKI